MREAGPRILADTFELGAGVVEALAARGVDVVVQRLDVGDYDLGSNVIVERKTIPDLHLSLQRGRLWRQIGELRNASRMPYLLIEGAVLDDRSTDPNAIRGACLAVIGQGVPILPSMNAADSARWLRLLALRRGAGTCIPRDRPAYAQRLKPAPDVVREAMRAAVPGISVVRARALLAHFKSVSGVIEAGPEGWLTVRGIGPTIAGALRQALH